MPTAVSLRIALFSVFNCGLYCVTLLAMLWHSSRFSLIPNACYIDHNLRRSITQMARKALSILGHMRCGILMSQLYKYFNSFHC